MRVNTSGRVLSPSWALAAPLSLLLTAPATAAPSTNFVLRALPASAAVVTDGSLTEWNRAGEIALCDDFATPHRFARVAAMYDRDGLYLAFAFRDATPLVNWTDPVKQNGQGWRGDAVQLRFWCEPEKPLGPPDGGRLTHVDCYWHTPSRRAAACVVWGDMAANGVVEGKLRQAIGAGVETGFQTAPDGRGYVQEMRIAWKLLRRDGTAYRPGERLRLGVELFWDTGGRSFAADRVTDLLNPAQPQRDYFWENREAWGTLAFVAADAMTAAEAADSASQIAAIEARWQPQAIPAPATAAVPILATNRPCGADTPADRLVNTWYAEGTAAGNRGDAYDNLDRGHSLLAGADFPQMTSVVYSAEASARDDDIGAARSVRPGITVGNSSTAGPAEGGGCHGRTLALTPGGLALLYAQYRGNNLYIYPEHQDHDPGHNGRPGHGDLLPANHPYLILSQGSSGSDQPFVSACVRALAALRPETKRVLAAKGLLMPTLQGLMRATNRGIDGEAAYLSGRAHPPVFCGEALDPERLVRAAHDLTPATLPPLALLRVLDEAAPADGTAWAEERLADTPAAVVRVHRRPDRALRLTLSAAPSLDPNGRPLTFRWVVLRGDPGRMVLTPRAGGREAEISIGWHGRFAAEPGAAIEGNRVDVGLFVHNGLHWSPPAFLTVFYPDHERRWYEADGRLLAVDPAAVDLEIGYAATALVAVPDVKRYDVFDWGRAFAVLCDGPAEGLPRRLFEAHAQPGDLALLREAAVEFAAEDASRTGRVAAILGDARLDRHGQKLALGKLSETLSGALLKPRGPANRTAKAVLEGVLNRMRADPDLLVAHVAEVDRLAAAAGPPAQAALRDTRQRIEALGPNVDRHHPLWRERTEQLNLATLNAVLYRDFLEAPPRTNYTDARLLKGHASGHTPDPNP